MKYDVYGIGNALLDIQYDIEESFLHEHSMPKGLMSYVTHEEQNEILKALGEDSYRQISPGGSVANSMIVLSHFGARTFYSCRIGNDKAGEQYYQEMQKSGLHSNFDGKPLADGKTGRCVVNITPDADRTMSTFLGTSIDLCEEQLNLDALKQSRYFYIEGYLMTSPSALNAVKKAIAVAKENDTKIAITLSDPDIVTHFKTQFHEIIDEGVDLIFCNESEAIEFTETDNIEAAKEALKQYTQSFVITVGPRGSVVYDGNDTIMVPATEEKPIDTLGAGDMYAGAFLFGITSGMSWAEAGRLANITSSKVVTIFGPRVEKEHTTELLAQMSQAAA